MVKAAYILIFLVLGSLVVKAQLPVINSVTPLSTYPNNKVLITGSGFSTNPAQLRVWFDNVAGSIVNSSDFSIEVALPPQARLANVLVTNLASGLSAKSDLKVVPFYSGTDFDPLKVSTPLSFSGGADEVFDVCTCDLDGDGKPDMLGSKLGTATDIMVQRNTSSIGTLSFATAAAGTIPTASPMFNLACGDLNGDGKPEVIATRGGATRNEVFIYRNLSTVGSISFAAVTKLLLDAGQQGFRIVIRDMDLDGKPDIIVSDSFNSTTGLVYVFANTSSGGTLSMNPTPVKVTITGANTTYGLDAQDLDGDKKPEIIVNQFNSNHVAIVKNSSTPGTIAFGAVQIVTAPGNLNHLTTADLNEDGKLDIAVTSAFENKVYVLLNTSSGSAVSFAAPMGLDTGDGPFGIDVSDIDGDGDIDIIVGNVDLNPSPADTQVTVLSSNGNNGSLAFTTLNINVGKKSRNLRVGDLDGDGKPDIAFTTVNSNSLDVIRNTNCFVGTIQNVPPLTICSGQTIHLTTVPGINVTTYDWQESGSSVSSGANNFYDITTAGNYTVVATSEAGACVTTSAVLAVTVGSGSVPTGNPPTTVSANSPVCSGTALNLMTPAVASVTYEWTGPAGFTSSLQNPTIPVSSRANAGVYTLVLSDGTCRSAPVTTTVEVADLAAFSVSSSVPSGVICTTGSLTLTVNSASGYTYQWIKDGSDIGGQVANTLVVNTGGDYAVRVTNTALACFITTSPAFKVKTVTAPVASFTVKSPACVNETLTFTSTSTTDPGATPVYAWTFGDAATSNVQNPTHAYATANNFTAGLTVTYSGVPGCSSVTTKVVAVQAAVVPTVTIVPPSSCPGQSVTLTANGTFNLISWSNNTTGASATVTQPGNYSVTTTDVNGCMATTPAVVNSKPVPTLTVTTDKPTVATGESAQLSATGADTYAWTPPETLSNPAIANPVATPTVTTTYTVTGTLTGACSAQATIDITVDAGSISIKAPNVFSPNGDGINDLWVITGIQNYPDCMLSLFDKNGKTIFEQRGYTNNWDGTYQGKAVPEGTYYYVFGCTDKGSVTGTLLVAR
jgi:gliding motility-associated-like protein